MAVSLQTAGGLSLRRGIIRLTPWRFRGRIRANARKWQLGTRNGGLVQEIFKQELSSDGLCHHQKYSSRGWTATSPECVWENHSLHRKWNEMSEMWLQLNIWDMGWRTSLEVGKLLSGRHICKHINHDTQLHSIQIWINITTVFP